MKAKFLAWIGTTVSLMAFLSLSACTSQFEPVYVTDMPVVVSQLGGQDVTLEVILEDVKAGVQEYVPGAYANSLTFVGQCENLSKLHGTINIGFVRVEQISRNQQQVIFGTVSVNTRNQMMEMRFDDHSTHYISTSALTTSLNLKEAAIVAQKRIENLELSDCDVTLTCLEDVWLVVCTEAGSGPLGVRRCKFEIDSTTMQILEP